MNENQRPVLIGEDNSGLPVPAGFIEAILDAAEAVDGSIVKQTGHMEQITDRDGPSASSTVALAASLEATDEAAKERIKHQLETVNDDERPVPFDSSPFEDSAGKMAKKLPATPSHTGDGGESIVYPRRSELKYEVELGYINTPGERGEMRNHHQPIVGLVLATIVSWIRGRMIQAKSWMLLQILDGLLTKGCLRFMHTGWRKGML